jgi:YD repeat-containing protein
VYDPIFHVYPISQTTPAPQSGQQGLSTTWDYDYDNNAQNDYILGLPTKETDPNGNPTSAQYDSFGRITRLIRPGDDSANPTIAITYHDANPFHTEIRQRIDTTRYVTLHRYYDGMGRQTRIENGSTTGGVGE